jgi:phosphatidate cytidylyltransferase
VADERKEREKTDELFEDLDKFFAPIKDVEWPEPEERPSVSARKAEGPVDVAAPPEPEQPVTIPDEPPRAEPEEPASEVEEPEEPPPTSEPAGVWVGGGEPEPLEEVEEEEGWPPPAEREALAREFAGEPEGPPAFEEPEEPAAEEPPSEEAVERAVEHFAGSVREEVEVEARSTEELPIVDVFAEEEEEGLEEEDEIAAEEPPVAPRTVAVGAEGLGGPSWQEPTTVEVGVELDRRPGERDVPAAFLTGLVLAALAIGSLAISSAAFAAVASVLVILGQIELYAVLRRRNQQPATAVGLVSGGLVLAAGYLRGEAAMLSMMALATIATFLWYMAVPQTQRRNVYGNIALTLLPVVYGPLLAGYALTTLALEEPLDGRALILAVIGLTFVYDTAAFVVGYFWGNRPLAPTVSPKKSWEGAIGATLVVIAISVAFVASWVDDLEPVGRAVGLALVVAVFAPLGDLAESLLKRDLGVKDMGSILPGHGGVMDRIDSVLFVAPAALIFFRFVL